MAVRCRPVQAGRWPRSLRSPAAAPNDSRASSSIPEWRPVVDQFVIPQQRRWHTDVVAHSLQRNLIIVTSNHDMMEIWSQRSNALARRKRLTTRKSRPAVVADDLFDEV